MQLRIIMKNIYKSKVKTSLSAYGTTFNITPKNNEENCSEVSMIILLNDCKFNNLGCIKSFLRNFPFRAVCFSDTIIDGSNSCTRPVAPRPKRSSVPTKSIYVDVKISVVRVGALVKRRHISLCSEAPYLTTTTPSLTLDKATVVVDFFIWQPKKTASGSSTSSVCK